MRKALITGVTGQDGSYLAELLLAKGYEVYGVVRRSSSSSTWRLDHLLADQRLWTDFHLCHGDLTDSSSLRRLIERIEPDEVYNLGAQSHVQASFEVPEYTAEVNALGTLRLLDAVRETGAGIRFYQASTSELFGLARETPQTERTPFHPRSPYGVAKLYAHWATVNYREAYRIFACNGILFNHESPRRGENFVTRKITMALAGIIKGTQKKLSLGNLDARRDWGFAGDYVEAMWLMLQQPEPDDYVIATGESHSVREFLAEAFGCVGLDYRQYVETDPALLRPAEVETLLGDAGKARRVLGWRPKVKFGALVRMMVAADLRRAGLDPGAFMAAAPDAAGA